MNPQPYVRRIIYSAALLMCGSVFFQSCVPVDNSVKPVTPVYMVTVKVIDHQSTDMIGSPYAKHLNIVSDNGTLLDKDISRNFSYTFNSNCPNVNLRATLSSSSDFISAIEIDANGKLSAYHSASCGGTEFEITDNIRF